MIEYSTNRMPSESWDAGTSVELGRNILVHPTGPRVPRCSPFLPLFLEKSVQKASRCQFCFRRDESDAIGVRFCLLNVDSLSTPLHELFRQRYMALPRV